MRSISPLLVVILAGATVVVVFPLPREAAFAQMMGGMREMMQRMMGDILPPGINPALLPEPRSHGAQLLARYCTQCHNLPGPGMHTAAEWPAVVSRMEERMQMMRGMMGGVEATSVEEHDALLRYLQTHAQRQFDPARHAELDTAAGRSFRAYCTPCHVLPDPRQHMAREWSDVVTRMRKNMAAMGKPIPDDSTTREIVEFLQHHADDSK